MRRPRSPIVASSIVGGSRGAFRQLHHHAIAILGDLNAGELAEQLRKLISAIAAHIEIGIALEKTAPNLSKARSLTVILVIRNDIGHSTLDLLDARPAALPRIRSRLPPMAAPGRFATFAHKQLKRGEDIARLAKRNGRLLLPHADDGEAAFADAACKTREIAIAGNDAKPLDRSGVHDVHGVDDHGRIGGIFARGVAELLNGRDRVLKQRIFPFRMQRARPVAIDTLVSDSAIF